MDLLNLNIMQYTWTHSYSSMPVVHTVTYVVRKQTAFGWENIYESTDYLQALAKILYERRATKGAAKVKMNVKPQIF